MLLVVKTATLLASGMAEADTPVSYVGSFSSPLPDLPNRTCSRARQGPVDLRSGPTVAEAPLSNGGVRAARTPERECHAAGGGLRLARSRRVCERRERVPTQGGEFRVGFGCSEVTLRLGVGPAGTSTPRAAFQREVTGGDEHSRGSRRRVGRRGVGCVLSFWVWGNFCGK